MFVSLREYQQKLVSEAYGHIKAGKKRILIQSPVGSGKTRTGARLVSDALSKNRRPLFMAHRKELVTQPRDTFAEFGMNAGIIKAGFDFEPVKPLQIASVQTLINRLDRINPPDVIIVDEAHHSTAGSWSDILAYYPDAIVIGLSGTPERTDGTGLDDIYEVMVNGPQIPWLIEQGFLVDCDVYGARDRLTIPRKSGEEYDYKKVIRALERRGRDGDPLQHFKTHYRPGKRGVGFGPSVEWCEAQSERFRAAGLRSFCLSGDTPDEERDEILAGYATGETEFVWNVDVIGEGTDIPDLEILVDCAKTKSLVKYIQHAGRILRPSEGKTRGIYIDLVGNAVEHGHPCIERTWSLSGESGRKKDREMTKDGEHLSSRRCENCFALFPTASQCPRCGHESGPDKRVSIERAAHISKLEKQDLERARKAAAVARKQEEAACQSLDEFKALGVRRGYKPGWAHKRWDERKKRGAPPKQQQAFGADGWPL